MKMKFILITLVSLAASGLTSAATNDLTTLLQRGLFEEEANHQLDAAIGDYKAAIEQFDHERQLAATAIFRLGECYRKQGRTNEANAQYERIAREFTDQASLAQLSQAYLASGATTASASFTSAMSLPRAGAIMQGGGGAKFTSATSASALPPDEEKFLRKVKESVQDSPDLMNEELLEAAQNGYLTAAEFLMAHGVDVNLRAPIVAAAVQGNEAMVRLLLSHGAEVNNTGEGHRTALHFAAEKGFMAVCRTLMAHGADVNATDQDGLTPLHFAVEQGNLSSAEFLITNKAHIDAKDGRGQTPLQMSINRNKIPLTKLLLAHQADPNLEFADGRSAPMPTLDWAIKLGEVEAVKLLLENHADPNAVPSGRYETPLMLAFSARQAVEIVTLLLDHGANPNAVNIDGRTAISYAIQAGQIDGLRVLVEHGANVNILDKNGDPPLAHLSSPPTEISRQMEELLINAGADANYNRRRWIWLADAAGTPRKIILSCTTNSINHYTLLDLLATLYMANIGRSFGGPLGSPGGPLGSQASYAHSGELVPFPDFTRIAIHRLDGKRAEVLHVNATDILQSGDSSKDVALQAGDAVEIPDREHKVADQWVALSQVDVTALDKCLLRTVQLVAQGRTNVIALMPALSVINQTRYMPMGGTLTPDSETNWLTESLHGRKADTVVRSFDLNTVVRNSNVLLNTWDLSRVRLNRGGAKMTFNLTSNQPPNVWLEDGDVIEISQLGEGAPAAETGQSP
jgi:ankyrin repeat protein